MKVLLVDDSKLARMAMTKALNLARPDWSRVEAANAEEAVAQVKSALPDIAVVDFNMPGTDGLALAGEVSALRPQMPIAIISANFQQEIVDRARAIGAAFLPKPVTDLALEEFLSDAEQKLKRT
jgi:DNA-binding NarL/FixJ family response regulator